MINFIKLKIYNNIKIVHKQVSAWKYQNSFFLLYNSVSSSDERLKTLRDVMNKDLTKHNLKYCKDDGDHGFKSDNRIHDTHRLNILLYLLFNIMI